MSGTPELKPIRTAPRDGRVVRVFHGKDQEPVWARWNRAFMCWRRANGKDTDVALQMVFYWIGEPVETAPC